MITVSNVSLRFGGRKLFEDVNLKFTPVTVMELFANGAKSTFLKFYLEKLNQILEMFMLILILECLF